MYALKYLVAVVFGFVAIYMGFSFTMYEHDPIHWGQDVRGLYLAIAGIAAVWSCFLASM